MDQSATFIVGGIFVLAFLGVAFLTTRKRDGDAPWTPPVRSEIARIEQITKLSTGGVFAALLLGAHNAIAMLAFFVGTKSAIQEASIGTIWIAGNVLWAACMLMGRKHTYIVSREAPPDDPPIA